MRVDGLLSPPLLDSALPVLCVSGRSLTVRWRWVGASLVVQLCVHVLHGGCSTSGRGPTAAPRDCGLGLCSRVYYLGGGTAVFSKWQRLGGCGTSRGDAMLQHGAWDRP